MAEVVKLRVDAAEAARLRALWATVAKAPPEDRAEALRAAAVAGRRALLPETEIEECLSIVAEVFGVPARAIRGAGRAREVVAARWMVIWLARQRGHSLAGIGRALDLDHTTVANALAQMAEKIWAADG